MIVAFSLWWDQPTGTPAQEPRPVATANRHVIISDGDSFVLGGQRIRLYAIDAPERGQMCRNNHGLPYDCGATARASLESMLKRPGLGCASPAQDRYGRTLAVCSVDGIPDIGKAQVQTGQAIALRERGREPYAPDEDMARTDRRGIWSGTFEEPWKWRQQHPRSDATSPTQK